MPCSEEERHEVARRLRGLEHCLFDDGEYIDCGEVEIALGLVSDDGAWYEADGVNRLADLIEPQTERTCQIVSAFDTDELDDIQEGISFSPDDTLAYMCKSCGFDFRYERGLYPNYCPNCGAKMVQNFKEERR